MVVRHAAAAQPLDHDSHLMNFMKLCRPEPTWRPLRSSRYHRSVPAPSPFSHLHPDTPPLRRHAMPVGDGHVLHVQEHGRLDGLPALVLHGGPGSGCSPLLRRFLDPARFRIVCVDQRGAGSSTPRGSIEHNTTAHLLADLKHVRASLGIVRWLVVGGSWGATLALAYAAHEPEAVAGLLLRASFLARGEDIDGFFACASRDEVPAWERFAATIGAGPGEPLLPRLAEAFAHTDRAACRPLARAWWAWEQFVANGTEPPSAPAGEALDALVDRYRVQSHYLRHRCWLEAPSLLERCEHVPRVPTLLLHGRLDRVCPPAGASALQQRLPHAALRWIAEAGHDPAHPAMAAAMVEALDRWAAHGNFGDGR
jgi:proline iminopeptidase